jgi:hypothetical protein
MIVKNEAENLPGVLDSITGLVDEIVVYDTGSTDDTVAIARAHGARVIEGYWDDDFARARNAALDAARADWILIVDGDDRVGGPHAAALRAYLSGQTHVFPGAPPAAQVDMIQLRVINVSDTDQDMDALESVRIARRSRVRWHGRLHELLRVDGDDPAAGRSIRLGPEILHIRHSGYSEADVLAAKGERNVRIAQTQLDRLVADGVDDPERAARAAFDLGRSQLVAGRIQDAVDAMEVVREICPAGLYRAEATLVLTQILLDRGGFDDVALFLVDELTAEGITSPQLCDWLRAQALARTGRRLEALALLRGITELVDPVGNRMSLERVLTARVLFAGAEHLFEESAACLLELVLGYGPRADRPEMLLRLWKGREPELAARIAADHGPFREPAVKALSHLGDAGRHVADLVRQAGEAGEHTDRPAMAHLGQRRGHPDGAVAHPA